MKAKMDEIDEIWVIYRINLAKIAIGTLIYHWKSILAVGLKTGSNMAVGSPYYLGITSKPSDHVAWRRGNIGKKSTIYLRYIADILPPEAIFSKNLRYISSSRYIADILVIFAKISPLRFFSTKYCVDPSQYTIYRWYIPIFSSLVATLSPYQQQALHVTREVENFKNRKIWIWNLWKITRPDNRLLFP